MKFRRVSDSGRIRVQAESKGHWIDLSRIENLESFLPADAAVQDQSDIHTFLRLSADKLETLQSRLDSLEPYFNSPAKVILPFEPASFRDFMLYEKHVIDSSRGYVKRFMPQVYKFTQLVERLTGKPFKKFRPHALWFKQPIYYLSNHLNFGQSGDVISWPSYTKALDYELEIGAVISKPLFNATPEEAKGAIGGFVVLNDFSARDVQRDEMESGFGPQKAKHFMSTISSIVVSADEILPHINDLKASVTLNDKEVSQCHSGGMYFQIWDAIAFASKSEQLHAGELFGSGTIPGGTGMENGHWLEHGDRVTLCIDRIGKLTNTIEQKA